MRAGAAWSVALAALLWIAAGDAPAAEGRRIAVVVGIDKYPSLKADFQLQRAAADARAVSTKLRGMGFSVETTENATLRSLDRLLTSTAVRTAPGDTVLLFFAGHGLSIRGQNFLLPADIEPPAMANELAAAETLRREAFLVDDVIDRLRANGASNIVLMLDACRNNPFRTNEGRSIGASRGLARQETPQGVFLLFSAGFGEEALDRLPGGDDDANSVFTRTLVPLLDRPGLSLTDLAKEVQVGVRTLTARVGHSQTPAYYDQIVGRLSLTPAAPVAEARPPPAEAAKPDPLAQEAAAFAALPSPASAASLRAFLAAYPAGAFSELARLRLASLEAPTIEPDPPAGRTAVAALEPTAPAPRPVLDGRELARRTQAALNRLGCEAGDADGGWGEASRAALERFSRAAQKPTAGEPSEELLAALEAQTGPVCRPRCGPGEQLRGDSCVARTCPPGSKPGAGGRCVPERVAIRPAPEIRVPPKRIEKPRPVRQTAPRRPAGGGGSCFTFNGRQVCE